MKRNLMKIEKGWLVLIIIIGGLAVLGSYLYGAITQPGAADILWGGVPQGIRPIYTANMLLATTSFFIFSFYILFRDIPNELSFSNRFGYWVFPILYAAILFPSAMWLPLTIGAVAQTSILLLWLVRIVLVVVGAASVSLFILLWKSKPRPPSLLDWLAIAGCGFFCIQTAILDALVWNIFFKLE